MWYILNGPVILIICILGSILNIYAIYVLSTEVFPSKGSFKLYCNYSNCNLKNSKNSYASEQGSTLVIKRIRRSRISIYLLWLTGCDAFLLICSIFNFSIPILINDYENYYMRYIPFWYVLKFLKKK